MDLQLERQARARHRRQPRHRQGGRARAGAGRRRRRARWRATRRAPRGRRRRDRRPRAGARSSRVTADTTRRRPGRARRRRGRARARRRHRHPGQRRGRAGRLCRAAAARRDHAPTLLQREIDIKVMGYIRVAREVAPQMKARGWGRIVNISGLAARQTGNAVGSIRNVAVAALTKNLADELGPFGINVTVVHPGLTRTERTAALVAGPQPRRRASTQEAVLKRMADGNSIRRLVDAGRGRRRRRLPRLAEDRSRDQRRRHRRRRRRAAQHPLLTIRHRSPPARRLATGSSPGAGPASRAGCRAPRRYR